MKTCELYADIDKELLCGKPATHEVRFQEEPDQWWATCKECLNDRQASHPMIVVLEARPLPGQVQPVPAHKCELEGDDGVCGRRAVMEVHFPEEYAGDGWIPACVECVDRRLDTFKMELREFKDNG